jgi:DNA-binding winged helix-turn-helix (wHTH) protein
MRELLARLTGVLRPIEHRNVHHRISVGALTLDVDSYRAFVQIGVDRHDIELRLAPTSYRLLRFFVENPDKVLSREEIIDHVWHGASVGGTILALNIKQLRNAMEPLSGSLRIETVRAMGFRLSSSVDLSDVHKSKQGTKATIVQSGSAQPPQPGRQRVKGDQREAAAARRIAVTNMSSAIAAIRRLRSIAGTYSTHYPCSARHSGTRDGHGLANEGL